MRDNPQAKPGIGRLCKLFGKSRQAFYKNLQHQDKETAASLLVLDFIVAIRRELPGLGLHKLYLLLREPLEKSGIKMGRDKIWELLRRHDLLVRKRRTHPKTTNSKHWMKKYPMLIKGLTIEGTEQVWVSDITYICVGCDFYYLSLITDAYSRKIVGYHLHPFLNTEGCLKALDMALSQRTKSSKLIHHSDRGTQYCSFDYVMTLKRNDIEISMTENGDPYENAIAERINGILKTEFKLNRVFGTYMEALLAVKTSVYNYNTLRPHMSCNLLTPQEAHFINTPLIKRWKSKSQRTSFSDTTHPLGGEGNMVSEKYELN